VLFLDSLGGDEITYKVGQLVVFKKQRNTFLLALFAAGLDAVDIIPAVRRESIQNERRTHDKLNLLFGHAGPQLVDHVLGDDVALLNVDLVDTRDTRKARFYWG